MKAISAVVRRELADYFSTPTGYVFISLFVFLSALAAFWQERFFLNNLANLDSLNVFFPYLLVFFVPAVSMSLFSEERKHGTDELLLTLPASDAQVVLGKYLAGVAIYTVALLFSLSHVAVLSWLGRPDMGLMVTTYLGYWMAGSALLAVAMLGSLLTDNLTIAFILGALFSAIPVFLNQAGSVSAGALQRLAETLSAGEQLRDAVSGVVTPDFVIYFAGMAAIALYLNVALLGRHRWPTGPRAPRFTFHYLLRCVALIVALGSLAILAGQSRWRWDATSEKVHSLAPDTVALLRSLDPNDPVFITAYFSPEVPRSYADARNGLSAMLREFEAVAGEAAQSRIIETVKYSPAAREADERFNIRPYRLPPGEESGSSSVNEIFLGLAFTRGPEEFVIPFFDRGLPAEYELVRSIRVVSRAKRKKIGVLNTPVQVFGEFDFQTRRPNQEWSIVSELRKQYEVIQVSPDSDYPADVDVLIAAQPSALMQSQADRLTEYVKTGKPVLLMIDPLPAFNLALAPQEPGQEAALMPFQQPPQSAKANLNSLLNATGVEWAAERVGWDNYNPHPQYKSLPKEFVFVGKGFNSKDPVTAGLQEAVLLYPGALKPKAAAGIQFTPLLETSGDSGTVRFTDLVQRNLFGQISFNDNIKHVPEKTPVVLAARVKGPVNAVIVGDVDLMGEQFFDLRKRGIENLNFDNVTFLLNAVDDLSGDSAFIDLRKRRPRQRTLEAVEARTRTYEAQRLEQMRQAEATAETRLKDAQARLDKAVAEIEQRKDLDEEAKQVMMANVQSVENRRLQVARTTIEDEKQRQIDLSRAEMENSIRAIQRTIKLLAVVLPPIPAVLLFLAVSLRRLARERIGVSPERLVEERNT
jgi:ABC-2 type transport system permease protein